MTPKTTHLEKFIHLVNESKGFQGWKWSESGVKMWWKWGTVRWKFGHSEVKVGTLRWKSGHSEVKVTWSSPTLAILSRPSPPPLSHALQAFIIAFQVLVMLMIAMAMTMMLQLVKVVVCSGHWLSADFSIGRWINGGWRAYWSERGDLLMRTMI